MSNESAWGVCEYVKQAEMKGLPRIATIQNLYNLTARGFETSLLDETCMRENVSLLAYSPLAFGQLSGEVPRQPEGARPADDLPADAGARATCGLRCCRR